MEELLFYGFITLIVCGVAIPLVLFMLLLNVLYVRSALISLSNLFIDTPVLFVLFIPLPFLAIFVVIGYFLEPLDDAIAEGNYKAKKEIKEADRAREERGRKNEEDWRESTTRKT